MQNREKKFTHNSEKDIHERDKSHLIDSYNAACSLVDTYDWYEVKCVKNGEIRTIDDIHNEIYNEFKKYI
jgi:dTMP kinase